MAEACDIWGRVEGKKCIVLYTRVAVGGRLRNQLADTYPHISSRQYKGDQQHSITMDASFHLTAIHAKLERIERAARSLTASLPVAKTFGSRRYGTMANGKVTYFIVPQTQATQDTLSRIIQERWAFIHIDEGPEPRLLCEHLNGGVDEQELMLAAIRFFFPGLREVKRAFRMKGSEYCFTGTDQSGYTVFMIFEYCPEGTKFNLSLTMKRQFHTIGLKWLEKAIRKMISRRRRLTVSKAAAEIITLKMGHTPLPDLATTDVVVNPDMGQRGTIRKDVPQTEYIQLIKSYDGMPLVFGPGMPKKNVTLCQRMRLSPTGIYDDATVDNLMNVTIKHYYDASEITPFFTSMQDGVNITSMQDDGSMCWKCTSGGHEWLLFFRLIHDPQLDGTHLLQLIGSCHRNEMNMNRLLTMATRIHRQCARMGKPSSVADIAYDIMSVLDNALESKQIPNLDQAEVLNMWVISSRDEHGRKCVLKDEFVGLVDDAQGILHEFNGEEPFTMCSDLSLRHGKQDSLIRASLAHFHPNFIFKDIERAFEGSINCLKAVNQHEATLLFVFAIEVNDAAEEFEIVMLKSAVVAGFTLQAVEKTVVEQIAGRQAAKNEFEYKIMEVIDKIQNPPDSVEVQVMTYSGASLPDTGPMDILNNGFIQLIINGGGFLCVYDDGNPNSLPALGSATPMCTGIDDGIDAIELMEEACYHYFNTDYVMQATSPGLIAQYGENCFKITDRGGTVNIINFGFSECESGKYNLYVEHIQ